MVSVTQRISQITQPRGGYLNPRTLPMRQLGGAPLDLAEEDIHASIVGSAVDYLTRWALDHKKPAEVPSAEHAFHVSVWGAERIDKALGTSHAARAAELCKLIDTSRVFDAEEPTLPTDAAIAAALELTSYDVGFRAGVAFYRPAEKAPNAATMQHVATMVERSLSFFREYGPVAVDGFTVLGGYTGTIDGGDGDFISRDCLWDFKVSIRQPSKDDTLQLLVYWLMARRSDWNWRPLWNASHTTSESDWQEAWDLDGYLRDHRSWPDDLHGPIPAHIGIYNPRLDIVYRIAVADIPVDIVAAVEQEVIGY